MTKILLVEDDKSLREIYGVRLLAEGYDIVSAGDGEDALAMAIKEKPTLIISDVMMPKISGFDMLDILRSTTETRDIKVIMMTALSSEDQRARGEQLGADRYLVKSQVGIEDVVRTVHEVLGDVPGASGAAAAAPAASTPAPEPTPVPAATDDTASSAAPVASAAPTEEDGAGPLPPQPTEAPAPAPVIEPVVSAPAEAEPATESSLPQPTAPFSSPRPTNLGEQVVQDTDAPVAPAPVDAAPAEEPIVPLDAPEIAPAPVPAPPGNPAGGLVIQPLSEQVPPAPAADPATDEQPAVTPAPAPAPVTPPAPGATPPAV